jgi:PAS domain S-box-containing protein
MTDAQDPHRSPAGSEVASNVLLVDDQPANLLVLRTVLDGLGHTLVEARGGEEALARLGEREFAVVLLDVNMPGLDGFETARLIRARAETRTTPIIFLTAYEIDRDQSERGYALGAVDFLAKPLVPTAVRAKVAALVQLFEEKARARRQAEQYRLLVEGTSEYAIFMLDTEGRVVTWNTGAERLKGYSAQEIVGHHFSRFYPLEAVERGWPAEELRRAVAEGRVEDEGWRLRQDGSRFWANVVITALRNTDGSLLGFAKVTRDLTERRQAEETQRELIAERAKLEEKSRTQEFQERFLAILGHDLRNPLASIDMGAGILRQLSKDPAMTRILDRMRSSSLRMSRMIEQILDLTRARLAGGLPLNPKPMDLRELIARVLEELRGIHPSRTIELRSGPLPGVWDPDRLEQVFSNLVGNALLYGDPARPVTIDGRREGRLVSVEVHNEGVPIPEAIQPTLFSPFRRGERDSRTNKTTGLGLGLYISREVTLSHGGRLDLQSSGSEGTTFRVTLPATQPATPRPTEGQP